MPRILLVEDNPDILLIFDEVLREAGFMVVCAVTFAVADELLASGEYDLLLTDGRLPGGTGLVLADKAKAKGIPAIIVTGYMTELRGIDPAIDLDAYIVLPKPIRPTILLAAVRRLLG
jgi:DNA-binding response OmpR family regulator